MKYTYVKKGSFDPSPHRYSAERRPCTKAPAMRTPSSSDQIMGLDLFDDGDNHANDDQ